jgi:Flavoprotein
MLRKILVKSKPFKEILDSRCGVNKLTKKMSHLIKQKNILIGCTGSVASIKLPNLISELKSKDSTFNVSFIVSLLLDLQVETCTFR